MFELIKKSFLASLGAAVVTKEKVEKATRKLVHEGKISKDEAEKLSQELIESGQKQWEEIQARVTDAVKKVVENLDIITKKDFQELNEKVEELQKKLAMLEQADKSEPG
jgi:polyhydroxyalkanoate synthesis regulator phasin